MARPTRERTGSEPNEYSELRNLLLAPEQSRLEALQEQVQRLDLNARNLSRILPDAIELRGTHDTHLSHALTPHVSDALGVSVRKRPQMIVDAIAPIMMPAIRQAIANALRGMVQSLNQTIEHSLSIRSLRWRLEAYRTGKPFAEIVLLHTLLYRVEQIFLIHKDSGLLLAHVGGDSAALQDHTLVSGMLSAIRSFVQDSFGTDPEQSLNTLRVGELTVWIEQGPSAMLAAVIRGTPPETLHSTLQDTLDRIHVDRMEPLSTFAGDVTPFSSTKPLLEECLHARFDQRARRTSPLVWMLLAGIVVAGALWGLSSYREREQWHSYLDRLAAEPGLIVTATDSESGRFTLRGLRDPLAADPLPLLAESGLAADRVIQTWSPFYALDPALILKRTRHLLQPPPTVRFTLEESRLVAAGSAPIEWIQRSRSLAPVIPGLMAYDDGPLVSGSITGLAQDLRDTRILFEVGGGRILSPQQLDEIGRLSEILRRLDSLARISNHTVSVSIVGQSDALGTTDYNRRLSQLRARTVREALRPGDYERITLQATGLGTAGSTEQAATTPIGARERRVSFQVSIEPTP
ncbi:MAG: OmpA family protein [Nitrospiraceae bacterium]|nr:OmpA family protein [Nitrospiraceae bacterium]